MTHRKTKIKTVQNAQKLRFLNGQNYNFGSGFLSSLPGLTGSIFGTNSFYCNGGSYFTNCNGSINTDATLGAILGNFSIQGLSFLTNMWINNRQENSVKTINSDVQALEGEINTLLAKLGNDINEDNYSSAAKPAEMDDEEYNGIITQLGTLIERRNNARSMVVEKILDDADDCSWSRTDLAKLKTLFSDFNNGTLNSNVNDVKKSDVRAAIEGYRKATPGDEQTNWARVFNALWEKLPPADRTNELRSARAVIPTSDMLGDEQ